MGKASISFEKKKEYAIESRVQKYATKQAARYRPYLSIKTPEKELVSFGGSAEYKNGKALKVDLTVDRIVSEPIKFFGKWGHLQQNLWLMNQSPLPFLWIFKANSLYCIPFQFK